MSDPSDFVTGIFSLMQNLGVSEAQHPPLSRLPCANVQVSQKIICSNPGTLKCSACKLVSYCSKDCQKSHWQRHKTACKDPMMRSDWAAAWGGQGRLPSFVGDGPASFENRVEDHFGRGLNLWGNTPAVDLLNLASNEKDAHQDYNTAFAASGDLRHIVKTVNGLPDDFSGKLNVVINDHSPPVVCRNITLLLILATVPQPTLAADIALHFWYSTFLPGAYRLKISASITRLMAHLCHDPPVPFKVSETTDLILRALSPQFGWMKETFTWYIEGSGRFELEDAQTEYDRVRTAPSRQDYRDRMYANLKPSHRVAFQLYRRFGLILPFGAVNAHFNEVNHSLFSNEGGWLQTDFADPLEGWDLDEVVEAGKRHGASVEDIYGCLYFFLGEQLIEFRSRLARFRISFKFFAMDARSLSTSIRDDIWSEVDLPSTIRFDRIAVSNIIDKNYVGLRETVTSWAPLLADTKYAAIFLSQRDGKCEGAGETGFKNVMDKMMKHPYFGNRTKGKIADSSSFDGLFTTVFSSLVDADALYENSGPFEKYLAGEGLGGILRENRLKLRKRHSIVPHRLGVPLDALAHALPDFGTEDGWYLHLNLNSHTWVERFLEFGR
ncbi:hypothetical protein BKA70DRAFT_1316688 [Coprinopsis sp. MPI-PUGE-AT-0042]|nr:hypothetical protein BKA70DRAFT_1316688 [Coprinopsis sp. MPI-PUGE-AT-0042]